jgi:hypothetical protein
MDGAAGNVPKMMKLRWFPFTRKGLSVCFLGYFGHRYRKTAPARCDDGFADSRGKSTPAAQASPKIHRRNVRGRLCEEGKYPDRM